MAGGKFAPHKKERSDGEKRPHRPHRPQAVSDQVQRDSATAAAAESPADDGCVPTSTDGLKGNLGGTPTSADTPQQIGLEDLAFQRQEKEEGALDDGVEEGAVPDAEKPPPAEQQQLQDDAVFTLCCSSCRGEKYILCVADDLLQDEVNNHPACGSYFLESLQEWMEECAAEVESKLNCPRCAARVGRVSWVGYEAMKGRWITPAIMLTRSKVDIKRHTRAQALQLGLVRDSTTAEARDEPAEGITAVMGTGSEISTCKGETVSDMSASEGERACSPCKQLPAQRRELQSNTTGLRRCNFAGDGGEGPSRCLDAVAAVTAGGEGAACEGSVCGDRDWMDAPPSPAPDGRKESKAARSRRNKRGLTDGDIGTMEMLELMRLVQMGELELDFMLEAMERYNEEKEKEKIKQMRKERDLSDPRILMASIKEEVPDTDEFMRFKAACGELSRGALSCDDYFTTQNATLRKLARSDIGSECPVSLYLAVVNMIPDEEIREDLLLRQAALTFTRKT